MTSFSPKSNGVDHSRARRAVSPLRGVASSPRSAIMYPTFGNSMHEYLKFAESNFLGGASPTFSRSELRAPLLADHQEVDKKASIAIFKTILKFMGDLPDYRADLKIKTHQPHMGSVMTRLYEQLGMAAKEKHLKKRDAPDIPRDGVHPGNGMPVHNNNGVGNGSNGLESNNGTLQRPERKEERLHAQMSRSGKKSRSGGTFSRLKATLHQRAFKERPVTPWTTLPIEESIRSPLDQLHLIIGYGIIRPSLRDEIYVQICKQLTDNPYKISTAKGWGLFTLCTGCFAPSKKLLPIIWSFLEGSPPLYTAHCKRYLHQTIAHGHRFQPPAYLEMESAANKKLLELSITLMDGTNHSILVDPNTTSRDLASKLAESINLQDRFGFSIYIAIYDKVASLGNGNDHVMDSISQCEQIYREQEECEGAAPWRLFFRKEMFAPWESATSDPVSTNLVYSQVVRGVVLEEYDCDDDQHLATLAAQQYYVEYGSEYGSMIDAESLNELLPSYIPADKNPDDEATDMWLENIMREHSRMFYRDRDNEAMLPSAEKVKQDVVYFAKTRFSIDFSRCYDIRILQGPEWPIEDLVLAVNWTGVYIMDDGDIIYELSYSEIATITSGKTMHQSTQTPVVTFTLVTGDVMQLKCDDSDDIKRLVCYMIDGLRKRSTFAVALENYEGIHEENIVMREGDLILLDHAPGLKGLDLKGLTRGTNDRTGQHGSFPTILVYVLNTLCKPSEDIVNIFKIAKLKNSIKKMNLHSKHVQ